jgi:hypothetical protein
MHYQRRYVHMPAPCGIHRIVSVAGVIHGGRLRIISNHPPDYLGHGLGVMRIVIGLPG